MWDKKNEDLYRFGFSKERKELINRVRSCFDIPSVGIIFVFEKEDQSNYSPNPQSPWKQLACHLNIKTGGIEEASPKYLYDIQESRDYEHLIWVSLDACNKSEEDFTWILAHEVRHLEQDLTNPILSNIACYLKKYIHQTSIPRPIVQNLLPVELDADLRAWRAMRKMYSKCKADDYVENKSRDDTHIKSFNILRQYNPDEDYRVIDEMIKFIRKYENELKNPEFDFSSLSSL